MEPIICHTLDHRNCSAHIYLFVNPTPRERCKQYATRLFTRDHKILHEDYYRNHLSYNHYSLCFQNPCQITK